MVAGENNVIAETTGKRPYRERISGCTPMAPSRPGRIRLDDLGALLYDVQLVRTGEGRWQMEYRQIGLDGRYHVQMHDGGPRRWRNPATALRVAEAAGISDIRVRF